MIVNDHKGRCRIQIRSGDSEAFVGTSTLAATAGACLSPEGEFAQELERKGACEE